MYERPDMDDLPHTEWECEHCGFRNSCLDGTCQNPDCEHVEEYDCDCCGTLGGEPMTASDVWFFVRDDGQIVKRVENDGWTYLHKGAQAVDTVVTAEYMKANYPAYYANYIEPELRKRGLDP